MLLKANGRPPAAALGSHADDEMNGLGGYPLWLTLIQGCRAFLGNAAHDVAKGPLSAMISHARGRIDLRFAASSTDFLHELRGLICDSVAQIDRRRKYMRAIDELNQSLAVIHQTSEYADLVDIFIWVILAEELIPLFERQEKEALAIFAHFCLLLNRLPPTWWLGDQTVQLMDAIADALGDSHRGWIRWPLEEIAGRGGKARRPSWTTKEGYSRCSEVPTSQS